MSNTKPTLIVENFGPRRAAISAIFFTNGLAAGCWAVLVPVIIINLGIGEADMGLIILTAGIAAIFALAVSPLTIALIGVRTVILIAAFLLAAGLYLVVNARDFWSATAIVMIVMAGLATQDVAMNADAGELENESGTTIMSAFHGFWSAGAMIGALLGGYVLAALGSVGLALGVGLIALLAALLAYPYLTAKATPDADGMPKTLPRKLLPWLFGLIAFSGFVSEGAVLDWSAHFLRTELASGVSLSGLAFGTFSFTMMLARFTGDRLRDQFGDVRLFIGSISIAVLGMLWVVFATSPISAAFGFALAGFGNANLVPIAFSAASQIKDLPKGAGIAAATFCGYAGLLVAPASLGLVGEAVGFKAVYGAMAALLLATLFITPALYKRS